MLDTPSSYEGQAGKCPKVDAAEDALEFEAYPFSTLYTPIAGSIFQQTHLSAEHPFTAKINAGGSGGLTSTNVPYDGESNEGALGGTYSSGASYWGRMMLYNSTRGTYRKIVSVNITTNVITTEPSSDSWADNDDITTQSQVNTQAGYVDIDVSNQIPDDATFACLLVQYSDLGGVDGNDSLRTLLIHPYESYDGGLRYHVPATLASEVTMLVFIQKLVDQKFTMYARHPTSDMSMAITAKGYF